MHYNACQASHPISPAPEKVVNMSWLAVSRHSGVKTGGRGTSPPPPPPLCCLRSQRTRAVARSRGFQGRSQAGSRGQSNQTDAPSQGEIFCPEGSSMVTDRKLALWAKFIFSNCSILKQNICLLVINIVLVFNIVMLAFLNFEAVFSVEKAMICLTLSLHTPAPVWCPGAPCPVSPPVSALSRSAELSPAPRSCG